MVLLAAIALVSGALLFSPDGVPTLLTLRLERQRLGEQAVALLQQNESLRQQIRRLGTDDRFLEEVARRQLGFVAPDEVVYRFRRPARAVPDAD
jgi:cell division protein FtsB